MSIPIPKYREFKGLVEINGSFELDKFYYRNGRSDADTINLSIKSVRFKPSESANWIEDVKVFFNGAYVRKNKGKPEPVVNDNNVVSIRLQGIDAPELHYNEQGLTLTDEQKKQGLGKEFRQHWGGRCVHELLNFLSNYDDGSGIINAKVLSKVDSPSDLFDTYGRCVGEIEIVEKETNLNHWLVQEGWAFPAYYNSMTEKEINDIDTKSKQAHNNHKGIWKDYSSVVVPFDWSLYLPSKKESPTPIDYKTDVGDVNFPKIFRRQVTYEVGRKIKKINEQSLKDYIETIKDDVCYDLEEVLEKGENASIYKIAKFIEQDGKIDFSPRDLVFIEKEASLKDSDGNKIEKWI